MIPITLGMTRIIAPLIADMAGRPILKNVQQNAIELIMAHLFEYLEGMLSRIDGHSTAVHESECVRHCLFIEHFFSSDWTRAIVCQ